MHPRLPRIGIDLLGSDAPLHLLLETVLENAKLLKNSAQLVVLSKEKIIEPDIFFHGVDDWIAMDEDPLPAVRKKKGASLCVGIRLLKEKQLDAFITSGNTGALLACAHLSLPLLQGISRPALMTLIPTLKHPIAVLDVGANVNVKVAHLVQFARVGIAYQKTRGITHPLVALLNNGTEENKGTALLQETFQELKRLPHFVGNIEARDVFLGKIDVLVTDGFTGNIFLKTAEGVGEYLLNLIEEKAPAAVLELRHHLDYAEYPGAILAGIDGIAIKCHGNGSQRALSHSIQAAYKLVIHDFIGQIQKELSECSDTLKF